MKKHHRRWVTTEREIAVGEIGKRKHFAKMCRQCRNGLTPFDTPHDLWINSRAFCGELESTKHFIPWEQYADDYEMADWREYAELNADLLLK